MEEKQMVKGKIITKGQFTEKIIRMKVKNITPVEVPYSPGQYISLKVSESKLIPYYVFRFDPDINAFEFAVNLEKDEVGGNYIKSVGVGSDVEYAAPQGELLFDSRALNFYFIAEGTYVSPFISFLYRVSKTPKKPNMTLFWGVKDEEELYLVNTLYAFSTSLPGFSYDLFISEGASTVKHRPGRVIDAIEKVQFSPDALIYVCGESSMISEVTSILKNKRVSEDKIIYEKITELN
jgi:NAD(P)H-flavin reductase